MGLCDNIGLVALILLGWELRASYTLYYTCTSHHDLDSRLPFYAIPVFHIFTLLVYYVRSICTSQLSHGFYSAWDSTALVLYVYLPRAPPSEVHTALAHPIHCKNHETTVTAWLHVICKTTTTLASAPEYSTHCTLAVQRKVPYARRCSYSSIE